MVGFVVQRTIAPCAFATLLNCDHEMLAIKTLVERSSSTGLISVEVIRTLDSDQEGKAPPMPLYGPTTVIPPTSKRTHWLYNSFHLETLFLEK